MQATVIREPEIRRVEDIIYKFIWNLSPGGKNSNGKINRELLQQGIHRGGLKAPNIRHINSSIKMKNLLRGYMSYHPVGKISTNSKIRSPYIQQAFNTLSSYKKIINDDVETLVKEESRVNKNYGLYYNNTKIKECPFF